MIEGLHLESRKTHQREHTIARLEERWQIVISHERYYELCQSILAGRGYLARRLSNEASVFLLAIEKDILVPVVFSYLTKQISTAWPIEKLRALSKEYRRAIYKSRHPMDVLAAAPAATTCNAQPDEKENF